MDDINQKYASLCGALDAKLKEIQRSQADLEGKTDEALARIAAERQALEDEKSRMTEVMKFHKSKVKLDVGGWKYTTSLATLTSVPDSMLGAMFSGRFHLEADESDGSFFVDRDGQLFKYILNFLRDPVSFDAPLDKETTRDLLKEAKYFGLENLVELLQDDCYHFKKDAIHLSFVSADVLNGVLNYIGTGGNRHEWLNPVENELVDVALNDGDDGGGDPVECICDHDVESGSVENCYDGVAGQTSVSINLKRYQVLVEHYMIAQEEGDENYLREWAFEGSNDGTDWETIKKHVDFSITETNLKGYFAVQPKRPYQWFRIRLTGPSSGDKCNFCITQIEFWGHLVKTSV